MILYYSTQARDCLSNKIVCTGDKQQFLSFCLLQRASSVLLISAAAQSLQRLADHSLQLPCFFIKCLKKHKMGYLLQVQCFLYIHLVAAGRHS